MTETSAIGRERIGGGRIGTRQEDAELVITGMACGSCAARIERRLNRLDGVSATVSYATGRAYFTGLGGRDMPELIGVINSVGYQAELPAPPGEDGPDRDPVERALGWRVVICAPLALATVVMAMVPDVQFDGWQWVSLALAAPVAGWGAWPLHRAELNGLGHGAGTMDTLVSLAVTASFGGRDGRGECPAHSWSGHSRAEPAR